MRLNKTPCPLRGSFRFRMLFALRSLLSIPPLPPLLKGGRVGAFVKGDNRGGFRFALRYALCAMLFLGLLGCEATLGKFMPPLEEEGEVYVYLQPFPQEAERLTFTFETVSIVSTDGRSFPLSLRFSEIKGRDLQRQRLLASGRVPPGSYSGFSFKVKNALLKGEEGEANLRVPEEAVKIDFPFSLSRRKARVLTLTFKYKESIQTGFSFSPAFSVQIPSLPLVSLMGYVTNYGSHNIVIFDKRVKEVASVIATGRGPAGMAIDATRRRAYVALMGDDTIEYIDVLAGDIVDRLRLNTGDHPQEIVLTPDGKTMLSANNGSNTVSFIDPLSLMETSRITVGRAPDSILLDSTGRRAFVFNTISSTVSVLDIPNKALITTISTDPGPLRGGLNKKGNRLYMIHELSSYLTVLDPNALTVVGRFKARMGLNAIKVDTNTDWIYLGKKNDPVVEAYDPFSFFPVDYVRAGLGVGYMTIDGEENNLYIVNSETNTVKIFNLISKKMVAEFDVAESPYWVTMMGER